MRRLYSGCNANRSCEHAQIEKYQHDVRLLFILQPPDRLDPSVKRTGRKSIRTG